MTTERSTRTTAAERRSRTISVAVALALCALFGALALRLVRLQVTHADRWRSLAVRQQQPLRSVPAYRGDIRTADGAVLARSVRARSAFCEPRHMGRRIGGKRRPPTLEDLRERARQIATALRWPPEREHALFERLRNPARAAFCWIARRLDERAALRLERARIPGVGFKNEYRREYPSGRLAAQLIGFTRLDAHGEIHGATGVERAYDRLLAGVAGLRETVRDGRGDALLHEGHLISPPEDGATVVLTIDSYIQGVTEEAIARCAERWEPEGIAALVLRPADGRVLAMASWPGFDPADLRGLTPEQSRNRTIMDTFEPGSIMKPLVAAAALEAGAVHRHQMFSCPSPWRYRGRTIRDVHALGRLDLAGVLVHSSNVGMAQVGLALGPAGMIDLLRRAGFGRRTGVGLPLEEPGRITPPERWSYYSTTSVAMGYELAVTPLQIASAFAALAADGVRYRPQIVERVTDADGRTVQRFE
ncbi:MAG: penicillin-binding protein 2, partial [Planctomycetota bacterium]